MQAVLLATCVNTMLSAKLIRARLLRLSKPVSSTSTVKSSPSTPTVLPKEWWKGFCVLPITRTSRRRLFRVWLHEFPFFQQRRSPLLSKRIANPIIYQHWTHPLLFYRGLSGERLHCQCVCLASSYA